MALVSRHASYPLLLEVCAISDEDGVCGCILLALTLLIPVTYLLTHLEF
jgi:hypothetical protein